MLLLKNVLSVVAAVALAEFIPASYSMIKVSSEKATGVAAVAGGFVESFFSPLFWVLAVLFFILFRWASRNGNRAVRVLLFWVPGVALSMFCIAFLAGLTYLFLHFRHS